MKTQYDVHNAELSERAHQIARRDIYPTFFNVHPSQIIYEEDTLVEEGRRGGLLDGKLAIDRVLQVSIARLPYPFTVTVQERFRRLDYQRWQDVTLTVWNGASNLPSELYKISAHWFVYGYFDDTQRSFNEYLIINVPNLIHAIIQGRLSYTEKTNEKQQTLFAFKFLDLKRVNGLVALHKREDHDR